MKVELWRRNVTLESPVAAANERHAVRSRLYLGVEFDGETGYGEVSPQPAALNGDPAVSDVLDELGAVVLPQLRQIIDREGSLPSWSRVARLAGPRAASNPAVSLVEMALLDREMRVAETSVEELWPPLYDTPLQSTVSLIELDPWLIDQGATRLRVKVRPGAVESSMLQRLASVHLPVLLDFNCSASSDAEVIELVGAVRPHAEIEGVEQPFAPGNVIDHARLGEQLDVAISLDEGIRSPRDIDQVVRYRAASIVCVKPARVGGLANARTIIMRAKEAGLRPYVGGFFESPYARCVHSALARSLVDEPSDLAIVGIEESAYGSEVEYRHHSFGAVPATRMLETSHLVTTVESTRI
ncbi:MAG: hypothetical protein HKL86_10705 [Acidimicrobiaceae bacterium]|nr:hypothetical protein [Acidimicrobiaceae bacterium]